MLNNPGKLLIVDEDESVRTSLSLVFSALRYCVRSSEDGRLGLSELIRDIPDILLTELNMVHMSSQEFLLIVRRRFPSIRVIAMGKDLSGHRVPNGVAADALYQKGEGPVRLIKIVETLTRSKRPTSRLSMDDLFGFKVFETIPPHPGAEVLTYPANRTLIFPTPKHAGDSESSVCAEITHANVRLR
jgi:DNA-binding NarL/FixJ family response regulator